MRSIGGPLWPLSGILVLVQSSNRCCCVCYPHFPASVSDFIYSPLFLLLRFELVASVYASSYGSALQPQQPQQQQPQLLCLRRHFGSPGGDLAAVLRLARTLGGGGAAAALQLVRPLTLAGRTGLWLCGTPVMVVGGGARQRCRRASDGAPARSAAAAAARRRRPGFGFGGTLARAARSVAAAAARQRPDFGFCGTTVMVLRQLAGS